jgi:MoxR-like ATPase
MNPSLSADLDNLVTRLLKQDVEHTDLKGQSMSRTAEAKSHLANIRLVPGGAFTKFPRVFLERMQTANYKPDDMRAIVKLWSDTMASNGYPDERIYSERASIGQSPIALQAFVTAIASVTANGVTEEDENEEEDLDLSSSPIEAGTTTVAVDTEPIPAEPMPRLVPEPVALTQEEKDTIARQTFLTNDEYFHGMKRHIPALPGTPRLSETYVNGDDDKSLDDVIRVVVSGLYPVRLVGDAGAGKTFMGKYIASELGLPYHQVSCDAFTEKSDFYGEYAPDGSGNFLWVDGPVTQAIEHGGIIVIEEYNMVKQAVLAALREVLTGGALRIISKDGIRVIHAHPETRLMATMNPKDYAGTNELSLAEMDRFVTFKWDYPSADKEKKILLANAPGFPDLFAEKVIEFANETRAKKKNDPELIRYVCSTRTVVKIARLYTTLGWSLRKCVEACVLEVVGEIDGDEYKYVEALVNARFPEQDEDLNGGSDEMSDPLAGGISL